MDFSDPDQSFPQPGRRPPGDDVPVVYRSSRRVVRPTIVAPPPSSWRPPESLPLARRASGPARRPVRRPAPIKARFPSVTPLMVTMVFFGCMMAVSFGQILYVLLLRGDASPLNHDQARAQLVSDTAVAEGLDTVFVLIGLLAAGLPLARRAAANQLLTWLAAVPGFVVFLSANVGFALALRSLAEPSPDRVPPVDFGLGDGWGWTILLVCVQPAVVEELFFRYLLFGHLRPHVGVHASVWVTAVVFGMAHLGNPIGWPILILLGAGLGYARACSGSLALPIALHFFHNLAVTALNDAMFR